MRRRFLPLAWASSMFLAAVMPGCQGSAGAFSTVQQSQASLADNQAEILRRLDAMSDQLGDLKAARPDRTAAPKPTPPSGPDPAATYRVTVGDEPAVGPDTAKVTLVEWSDFQCGYCRRTLPILEQLEKKYGAELRVVFKHNPLSNHPRAMPAAIAAEAAHRQGRFWAMHDKLFANANALTDENFVAWAEELGLDVERFRRDLSDPRLAERVEQQLREGMTLGVRGTPSFFVNGRFVRGARPVEVFEALIDEELKEAEALIAKGVAPQRVYEAVIADGKTRA